MFIFEFEINQIELNDLNELLISSNEHSTKYILNKIPNNRNLEIIKHFQFFLGY